MAWPVFWCEWAGDVELTLRRYQQIATPELPCPGRYAWHNATIPIGRAPQRRDTERDTLAAIPVGEYAGDPRWPTRCDWCAYEFGHEDAWQVNQDPYLYALHGGGEWLQHKLPVGAMFNATWMTDLRDHHGPDGLAVVVVLPPEQPEAERDARGRCWNVDSPSTSGGHWTRTGEPRALPPTIDVNPSILTPDYHGYLRNGMLTDPI